MLYLLRRGLGWSRAARRGALALREPPVAVAARAQPSPPLSSRLPNRIVKLVRAIRNGWLKTRKQKREEAKKEQEVYLLWGDDDQVGSLFGRRQVSLAFWWIYS